SAQRRLAAKRGKIRSAIEGSFSEFQELPGERIRPAAVARVAVELAPDVLARQRLVDSAADVRLTLLVHAPVIERHAHMAGVGARIGVGGIDDVANLAREPENA